MFNSVLRRRELKKVIVYKCKKCDTFTRKIYAVKQKRTRATEN